jgi:excisionase family DNA binding protein
MSLEETLRGIVREEVRSALRELLPVSAPKTVGATPGAYISTAEAGALADVLPDTVRDWIAQGKLPGYRAGREWRVRRDELEALMAHGAERAPAAVDLKKMARDLLTKHREG